MLKTARPATGGGGGSGTVTIVSTSGNIAGGPITNTGTLTLTSNVVTINEIQTLTSKRVTPRILSATSSTSPFAWNSNSYDEYAFTALANSLTISADSGSPTDGQKIVFRFKDNGTAQTLSFTSGAKGFRAVGVIIPTTTVASKTLYIGCFFNSDSNIWDMVALAQET
jgi:hypothetical protein